MKSDCEITSIRLFGLLDAQGTGNLPIPGTGVGVLSFTPSLEITPSELRSARPAPKKPLRTFFPVTESRNAA
ncbi:hypothetical protein FOXG_21987 [Fusarium oxysporum f. sp. lycopersici 4287]|uniref:Uncharacterized protein n=1 Tax=Fusarium oxysporum f. sp. lycopersici (strain 4287 / CBS 123668 / FGSC 9935 / NRRL 34936) TaxID=426428 RepID=A0A0J9W0G2_FUSO4|nr:hypothetical protein FOXG_21698 [Fusarium oxysporum f. sp. lycopersici 4287]XP_018255663.1 hypothetical protein FOXG_21987 [Fusarium oxysporum f. sp. lycopersici 4287]KNB16538.1 hypothetical protein FOXG_21698 [Fusarium oxysporum f. sp. lycopersici 4287]KNB17618.1 hypothetical protein FOXG_21987 [Fusarium oxysporum f. sp. lycopersici 4287]